MKKLSSVTISGGLTVDQATTLSGVVSVGGIGTGAYTSVLVRNSSNQMLYRNYSDFLNDISGSLNLSGYVPTSRTLTINGTTYDLSANRSWTITTPFVSKLQHTVKAGVAINKGQAVYVTSADGTNMIVGLASNASEATSSKTMGLLDATVSTNGFANVVTEGLLAGLDTSTAGSEGDPVWLGTGGNLIYGLGSKPYAPAHLVFIGIVTRKNANNGEIFVKVQNGFELREIHDVDLITSAPTAGQLLRYESDGLWKNWSPNYLTAESDTLASVTGRGASTSTPVTFNGNVTLGNSADLVFQDLAGTFPTSGKGFDWTLNNDGARIYAMQPSSDSIDLIFQLRDNATVNDRFVFWVDDYQGAAFDKYPLIIRGGTEFDLKDSSLYTNNVLRLSNSGVLQNVTGNISMFTNNAGYLTSYSETDTLASVTGRGATTTTAITVRGITATKDTNQITINRVDGGGATWQFYSWPGGLNIFPNSQLPIFIGRDGSVTDFSLWNGKLLFENKNAIEGNYDSWLRLNNSSQYASGVYTPGVMRADGGFNVSGSTVWHAGNDGSGSGLDADTVDGVQADSIVYGNARGTNQSITNNNNDLDKTGYYTADGFTTKPSGVANWMYIEHIKLYNDNTAYQKQLGYDTYDDRMWVRTKSGGAWSSWKQIWTSDVFANNSSNWNTAFGWGNHASAGYQPASTAITTSNIGSQSVSYANNAGYASEAGQVINQSGQLLRFDNRTISPSETTAGYLQFGFTSWANDNSAPYADYLHMRSYTDGSGGTDNLVMFKKSGIGMRIYQQTFGSTTPYADYVDVWTTANFTSTNVSNWNTAYGWGNHASASYATTSYVTTQINNLINGAPGVLDTLDELAAALGDDANFATTVTNSIAGKVSKAGDTMTGALTIQNGPSATWDYMTLEHPGPYARINLGNAENGFLIAHEGTTTATFATNGNLTITGALIETSSIKVKENIETSEGNLEKVVNLRPVTYNKIGSQTKELGLIAEEVAEVYPEFVQYDENGEPIGVNYSRLTAALIGAVKQLTQRIETLEKNG